MDEPVADVPEQLVAEATLTLADAARVYRVSESTLRRRLSSGAVEGARKVPGPKGEEWHLPVTALEQLGYRRAEGELPPRADSGAELRASLDAVARLTEALDAERRRAAELERARAHAEAERQQAALVAARAEAVLAAEREATGRVTARLSALEERVERLTEERDRYAQALGWAGRRRLRREEHGDQLRQDERERFRTRFIGEPSQE